MGDHYMTVTSKQGMLSIQEYIGLNPSERITYICSQLDLTENYLIGTIKPTVSNKFYVVDELVNPYNGKRIAKTIIENTGPVDTAFVGTVKELDKLGLEKGQSILFPFLADRIQDRQISFGEFLSVDKRKMIPIENAADVIRELELSIEEILGNLKKTTLDFHSVYFISDFYQDMIGEKLQKKWEEVKAERTNLEQLQLEVKQEQVSIKEQKKEMEATITALERLGIRFSENSSSQEEKSTVHELEIPEDENEFLKKIQQQLGAKGLKYERDTLRKFYFALKTNQLVVLSGPSGTGKTSLVSAFADLTSSPVKVIPVQPSWTDKQDLLGYYNPVRQQYVPTSFLDALIEAGEEKNKDKLYFICLDEINLAQIEYYLADILSVREQEDAAIDLYSKYEYEQNREEVNWYIQKMLATNKKEITTPEEFDYIQREKNLTRYPGRIHIPNNVRLIGTMNIDGTVRPLSPKVVDRSFVIHLERQKSKMKKPTETGVFNLTLARFTAGASEKDNTARVAIRNRLGTILQALHASFNTRVENHLDNYAGMLRQLSADEQQVLNDLISMKILPRINFLLERDTEAHTALLQELIDLVGEEKESYKKVEAMLQDANKTSIFTYWS